MRRLLFFTFLAITFVFVEPAPFDILLMLAMLLSFASGRKIPFLVPSKFILVGIYIFCIANIVSLVNAPDLSRGIFYFAVSVYLLLASSYIASYVRFGGFEKIIFVLDICVLSGAVAAVAAVLGIFRVLPGGAAEFVTAYDGTRAKGFFKDPNVFGPYLVFCLTFLICRSSLVNGKFFSAKNVVYFPLLGLGVLVSFSRAAWLQAVLSIVLTFPLLALAKRNSRTFVRIAVGGFVATGVLATLVYIVITYSDFGSFFVDRFAYQEYDDVRFLVQKLVFEQGLENFWGMGPGQSEVLFDGYAQYGSNSAQNLYIRAFGEHGVFGLVGLVLILWGTAVGYLKCFKHGSVELRVLTVTLAVNFLSILFVSSVIDTVHWRHFFVVLGLSWGCFAVQKVSRRGPAQASNLVLR